MGMPLVPFSHELISRHVQILASDEFEGRAPGSEGEKRTIGYLSEQFSALSLTPAGDEGGWTQSVPLRKSQLKKPAILLFKNEKQSFEISALDDIVAASFSSESVVRINNAPLVFVGYGVSAPEIDWDDYKGHDLKGKVAVILVNDPGFEGRDPSVVKKFYGKEMTQYGRWNYKIEEATRRGAAAAFIIHEDDAATYGWNTVRNSFAASQFDLNEEAAEGKQPQMFGFLSWSAARRIFAATGLDLEDAKLSAASQAFSPIVLHGLVVETEIELEVSRVASANVVACLPGCEKPDECIIYCGHWDHLGVGCADKSGDCIYHGAIDNATAVAGLIELARVFSNNRRTRRSIYFIAFTAEEKGLLGSEFYVNHPASPTSTTAAVFNMELLGIGGPMRDVGTWGSVRSDLHDALKLAAVADNRRVSLDDSLEAGFYFRSDHFPFAKRGVPGITISSGRDLYKGGSQVGRDAYLSYIREQYHQPADCWRPDLDLRGVALDLNVIYRAGREIAESARWPQWNERAEFRTVRQERTIDR